MRLTNQVPQDLAAIPTPTPVASPASSSWSPAYSSYQDVAAKVESVTGWLAPGQEKLLFDIAHSLPDHSVILEMGAFLGRSTCALAFACVGTGKRIYSIDSFCGNDGMMGKTDSDNYDVWLGNLKRFGLDAYATGLRGWTDEVLKDWHRFPKVDFVFIDASHEYLDVLRDFEMIYPFVKDNGWIAFHDVEPGWPGPWRTWINSAMPVLVDYRYASTLAAGRKPPAAQPIPKGFFSFSENWVADIERNLPGLAPLAQAMRTSLAGKRGTVEERNALLKAELTIGSMPKELQATLGFMVLKDGSMDAHLHLWRGLTLITQARCEEGIQEFTKATRVSFALPEDRVADYRRVAEKLIRDPSGGAVPPPPADVKDKHYRLKDPKDFDWWDRRRALYRDTNLDFFQSHVRSTDQVIELGCGEGLLLEQIKCRSKIGIESHFKARKVAALNFGIDTFDDTSVIPPSWAQVIIADHMLESLPNPLETLKSLVPLLARGGKMVFSVSWGRPRQEYQEGSPANGLYRWDPQSLGNLFKAAGLQVLELESGTLDLTVDCMEPANSASDRAPAEEYIVRIVAGKP